MNAPVRVGVEPLEAVVTVSVAEPRLSAAIAASVERAVRASLEPPPARPRVVRLRTRKRLLALGADAFAGAVVVIRVTEGNARRLGELVEAVRPTAAAVQLVWDGEAPPRGRVERHVFAVLERARATPAGAPVVLAPDAEPAFALRLLIARRSLASP